MLWSGAGRTLLYLTYPTAAAAAAAAADDDTL